MKTNIFHYHSSPNAGIKTGFKDSSLTLSVDVPLELRKMRSISVADTKIRYTDGEAIGSSTLSDYLNLRTRADTSKTETKGNKLSFDIELENVLTLYGWTLDTSFAAAFSDIVPFEPKVLTLTHDLPQNRTRITAGDIFYGTQGFQSRTPLQGISLSRHNETDPAHEYAPFGEAELTLEEDSQIEIYVNGKRNQTLRLPAGRYLFRDFNLSRGSNAVEINIQGSGGEIVTKRYTFPFDNRLIPPGESEFSYAVGIPPYTLAFPLLTAFHDFGITETFTAGFNIQSNDKQQLIGGNALFATPFGIVGSDIGFSYGSRVGPDFGFLIGYTLKTQSTGTPFIFSASLGFTGPYFIVPASTALFNRNSWNATLFFSRRMPFGINLGSGITYRRDRITDDFIIDTDLNLSTDVTHEAGINLHLNTSMGTTGRTDWKAFITLSLHPQEKKESFTLTQSLRSPNARIDWSRYPSNPNDSLSLSAGIEGLPPSENKASGVYLSGAYNSYRFEAGASGSFGFTPGKPTADRENATLRFASALVFADGIFSISRPVFDSFVLVIPNEGFKNNTIGINPTGTGYTGIAKGFLPGVIPSIKSYTYNRISVESPDLNPGQDLGPGRYTLFPGYRSGTILRIGKDAEVFAGGSLMFTDGRPAELLAGEAFSTVGGSDGSPDEPIPFFTDRSGRFELYGLSGGNYILTFFDPTVDTVALEIPQGSIGYFDFGIIELPLPEDTRQYGVEKSEGAAP